MEMHDLLEYSDNYSMKSGMFWNYFRDKVRDDENENDNFNNGINNKKTIGSKPFEYKTKIQGDPQKTQNPQIFV